MATLYIFLDEAGNFDFSMGGTPYFCLSAISGVRPFRWDSSLLAAKCDLLETDLDIERFHASEDRQYVRDKVFQVISEHLPSIRIDSLIVEKQKTQPHLQVIERFFPLMLGYLVKFILAQRQGYEKVIVITDRIPNNKKREAIEKGVKQTLSKMLPAGSRYHIFHHPSHSCMSLQVADYCNWAIYRKWDRGDTRSYNIIQGRIESEFDIFKAGERTYY